MCRYNRDLDAQLAGKASEGLSKLLAYLRDEDERERLAGIERLKPVGTQVPISMLCTLLQLEDMGL